MIKEEHNQLVQQRLIDTESKADLLQLQVFDLVDRLNKEEDIVRQMRQDLSKQTSYANFLNDTLDEMIAAANKRGEFQNV